MRRRSRGRGERRTSIFDRLFALEQAQGPAEEPDIGEADDVTAKHGQYRHERNADTDCPNFLAQRLSDDKKEEATDGDNAKNPA